GRAPRPPEEDGLPPVLRAATTIPKTREAELLDTGSGGGAMGPNSDYERAGSGALAPEMRREFGGVGIPCPAPAGRTRRRGPAQTNGRGPFKANDEPSYMSDSGPMYPSRSRYRMIS